MPSTPQRKFRSSPTRAEHLEARRLRIDSVVAGLYHANGFGVRPAVVLRTAKQIELAHGHGHIGLFRNAFKNAVEDRILDVGIHLYPASGSENLLHGRFRAKNKKIDHITRMA